MRYQKAVCPTCIQEDHPPPGKDGRIEGQVVLYSLKLRDDLTLDLDCMRGHKWTFIIQQRKYEILFELGVAALLDGYAREAVLNFAGSIERLYEHAIRVFLERAQAPTTGFAKRGMKSPISPNGRLVLIAFCISKHLRRLPY
jgi:hypothetical protein